MLAFRTALNPVASSSGDPYFANVSLLMHMDGTNGSTTFIDNSSSSLSVTANGGAQISTAQSKFGGASGYFQRSLSSYVSMSSGTVLNFGSSDFTVEGWIYLGDITANATKGIISGTSAGSFGFRVGQSYRGVINGLSVYKAGVADCERCAFTFLANTWYHVAVVRASSVITFYVNGSAQTTTSSGVASYSCPSTTNTRVAATDGTAENYNGYIDDIRVTKGIARYTANFTPPSGPFPNN